MHLPLSQNISQPYYNCDSINSSIKYYYVLKILTGVVLKSSYNPSSHFPDINEQITQQLPFSFIATLNKLFQVCPIKIKVCLLMTHKFVFTLNFLF